MSKVRTIAAICVTALVCSVGTAGASHLITSKQVQDNTLQSKDIRNHTIKWVDLSRDVQKRLNVKGVKGTTTITSNGQPVNIDAIVKAVLAEMDRRDAADEAAAEADNANDGADATDADFDNSDACQGDAC